MLHQNLRISIKKDLMEIDLSLSTLIILLNGKIFSLIIKLKLFFDIK